MFSFIQLCSSCIFLVCVCVHVCVWEREETVLSCFGLTIDLKTLCLWGGGFVSFVTSWKNPCFELYFVALLTWSAEPLCLLPLICKRLANFSTKDRSYWMPMCVLLKNCWKMDQMFPCLYCSVHFPLNKFFFSFNHHKLTEGTLKAAGVAKLAMNAKIDTSLQVFWRNILKLIILYQT